MKSIYIILALIAFVKITAQEYYFVSAKNGLNVRSTGNVSSKKVAKLPYGSMVEKIAETDNFISIVDGEQLITGRFVKVKYNNYTYLINQETILFEKEGYVFDAYLKKKENNTLLEVSKISKSTYKELLKKVAKNNRKPKKVSDLDSIKILLNNRVNWLTKTYKDGYQQNDIIEQIITKNGQILQLHTTDLERSFNGTNNGYFPEYDILFLSAGHNMDACFSITTGETELTAGNPEYIVPSPKNTHRLNGYFGGHECVTYFFQAKKNGEFTYLTEFNSEYDVCWFKEFYWLNEYEFIYSLEYKGAYYKGKIKN